jgi:nucleoside-diphosphate-sugar epimerase
MAGADARDEAAYRRAYVDGPTNLLRVLEARRTRPQRIFYTSSTGVYAQSRGEWVDETSATEPRLFTGRHVLEGERRVLSAAFPATVVRFGGIYGPGRTRLVERVRRGEARFRPGHYTNRIHRDDAAACLDWLCGREQLDAVYLGVDCEPAEEGQVLGWLAERLDAPAPQPQPEEGLGSRVGSKRCRNDRLRATGYGFLYPSFREGYAALLERAEARP